jgi:hypothetical protein
MARKARANERTEMRVQIIQKLYKGRYKESSERILMKIIFFRMIK